MGTGLVALYLGTWIILCIGQDYGNLLTCGIYTCCILHAIFKKKRVKSLHSTCQHLTLGMSRNISHYVFWTIYSQIHIGTVILTVYNIWYKHVYGQNWNSEQPLKLQFWFCTTTLCYLQIIKWIHSFLLSSQKLN